MAGLSSCCQMRRTVQPRARRVRVTRRSRVRLAEIFLHQKAALVFGWVAWSGQPCQKQPSTKTASLRARKTKSGFTRKAFGFVASAGQQSVAPRRQPLMPWARKTEMSRSSVAALPRERMADMTAERFRLVKTSLIYGQHIEISYHGATSHAGNIYNLSAEPQRDPQIFRSATRI